MIATGTRLRAALMTLAFATSVGADAATITWNNPLGGSYTTGSNWSSATVPLSTDDVVFSLGNTYTVNFPTAANRTNRSALIDGGTVTFDIGGAARNYTLTGVAGQQDLVVGQSNTATLTLTNGTLTTPSTRIGSLAGSNGTLNVNDGATLDSDSYFIEIGGAGTGRLNVNQNGHVIAKDGILGASATGVGTLSVTGAGSSWTGSGALTVGDYGEGHLSVIGGTVTSASGVIADEIGSTGTAQVNGFGFGGTSWTMSGDLRVGNRGTGSLDIGGQGVVSNTNGYVGANPGSSGTVTVDGTGSRWTNSSALIVGSGGSGSLAITNGGLVESYESYIAVGAPGTGSVTIGSGGSQWTNAGDLYVGGSFLGAGGTGSLSVNAGGTLSVGGMLKVWNQGSVTIADDFEIGSGATGAESSAGSLILTGGGDLSNQVGYIGRNAGSTGSATVTGAGSQWVNSGAIYVGNSGTGSLAISNGGSVSNGTGFIGYGLGSNGTVTVDGAGSQWTNSGFLYVGDDGTGSLAISNGGSVWSTANGNIRPTGTVTVDGAGSQWTSGAIGVAGSLAISNGGSVWSKWGGYFRSTGTVTVDGVGSQLVLDDNMIIGGTNGTGSLVITNGGSVLTRYFAVDIGAGLGENGTVIVDGAGSQLSIIGDIHLGNSGTGSLIITNGGTLMQMHGGWLYIGALGTVTLNGGTLDVGAIENLGTFNFTAGTLDVNNLTVGTGGLFGSSYSLGSGRTLVVDNATTIDAGASLAIAGGAFSSGSVALNGGTLTADSLGGIGSIAFNSGTLNAGSLTIGTGGPLGANYTLGTGRNLNVTSATTIDAGALLAIAGGAFSSGSVALNGGTLTADSLGGIGSIAFNSGTLNAGSLTIGTGGPLGANYTLGAGRNLNVTNATTIDVGSSLVINGGNFTTGSLVKNGSFQFLSGTIDLGSTALFGAGGVLGSNITLGAGQNIVNSGPLSLDPGTSIVLNGGTLSAGAINLNGGTFDFTSGLLELSNSGLTVGAGGLLGSPVVLDANRQVSVSGTLLVENGASLTMNGGTLTADAGLTNQAGGTINAQGTIAGGPFTNYGSVNLTGNANIQADTFVGDYGVPGSGGLVSVAPNTVTRFYGDVLNNGGIAVGAGGRAYYYGAIEGAGELGGPGTHTATELVSPGNSPGVMSVEGDLEFVDTTTLLIEIAGLAPGTQYDVVDVGGEAWLDGTLDVDLLDGFVPANGDSFDILFAEVLHGAFASTVFPTVAGIRWELRYLLNPDGVDIVRLTAAVPVPPAVWMLLSGLGVLGVIRRRATMH